MQIGARGQIRAMKQQSLLQRPNEVDGHIIDEFMCEDVQSRLDVTVQLPGQNVSARLQPGVVFYQVGSKQLELRGISLDEPLKSGCSGALVTCNNQAVGLIVAVEDHFSEAYIMTCDAIVKDIARVTGKTVRLPLGVELPTEVDSLEI